MLSTHRYGDAISACSGSSLKRSARIRGTHDLHAQGSDGAGPSAAAWAKYGWFPTARQSPLLPTAHMRFRITDLNDFSEKIFTARVCLRTPVF
jgi:hypothetical protein